MHGEINFIKIERKSHYITEAQGFVSSGVITYLVNYFTAQKFIIVSLLLKSDVHWLKTFFRNTTDVSFFNMKYLHENTPISFQIHGSYVIFTNLTERIHCYVASMKDLG
jgi:hypothetical protein